MVSQSQVLGSDDGKGIQKKMSNPLSSSRNKRDMRMGGNNNHSGLIKQPQKQHVEAKYSKEFYMKLNSSSNAPLS